MKQLYRRGDVVKYAYFTSPGPLYIAVDSMTPEEIPFPGGIIGTLEHFLENLAPRFEQRLFDLYIADSVQVKAMPFQTVDQMITSYDFGFNTNVFLSRLLEATTGYYLKETNKFSEELRAYQIRAIHFANLIQDLSDYQTTNSEPSLENLIVEWKKLDIFIDGTILARYHRVQAISVLPNPLSKWIELYKKNSGICREGAQAQTMYILLEGKIAVAKEDRFITEIDCIGEAFGELGLFLDGKRTASLIAEEDCKLYVLKRKHLRPFHKRHDDVFYNIACTLAKRVHDNIERIMRLKKRMTEAGIGVAEAERSYTLEDQSWKDVQALHSAVAGYAKQHPCEKLAKIMSLHSVY